MTKLLENLFNLPGVDVATEESVPPAIDINSSIDKLEQLDNDIDKIDSALPLVKDLDAADSELDSLAELSKRTAEDLISLGMNVEARYSGTILQTAGIMMGHAITAKQAKIDKKLRMVDLQLKKMRLDQQNNLNKKDEPAVADAKVIDRNELLRQILTANKAEKTSK